MDRLTFMFTKQSIINRHLTLYSFTSTYLCVHRYTFEIILSY